MGDTIGSARSRGSKLTASGDVQRTLQHLPIVVIAAAGNARRFLGEQKVLARVGGVPAVCRVARACEEGIGPHRQLVVIGHEGEQVREAMGEDSHRGFVYQYPQSGTGHALMVALESLNPAASRRGAIGARRRRGQTGGEVYFLCGDKPLVSPDSLSKLRARLHATGAAMVFMTGEIEGDPAASRQGRVIRTDPADPQSEVLAIVERPAIDALADGEVMTFRSADRRPHSFTKEQLLQTRAVNASVYGWRWEALRDYVRELPLHQDRAEYFVTDMVEILRRHDLSVRAVPLKNGQENIGIDTKELLEAAKVASGELWHIHAAGQPDTRTARPYRAPDLRCSDLLRALDGGSAMIRRTFARAYGSDQAALVESRRSACRQVARRFLESFGDRHVRVFRVPGRIAFNPHCEHQGAWVPYGRHRREIVFMVSPRRDDLFTLSNVDSSHRQKLSFRLGQETELAPDAWGRGWIDYIEAPEVARRREVLADPKHRTHDRTGSINYVKAAALRLAREADGHLHGADIVVYGDIPQGVGQSSSSALTVGVACALNDFWGLGLAPEALAATCGEAEWYLGTRGGAGDHAAMLLGSHSGLTGIRFEPPVKVRETRPMCIPSGYQVLIVDSGQRAIKSKEERRPFNAGIFAYRFALLYLQQALETRGAELGLAAEHPRARCLADISTEQLPLHVIYHLLLDVPEIATPQELLNHYPRVYQPAALGCFGTADPELLPKRIPVRGAAIYGLGRVDRGLAMHELCERGNDWAMREFGRLMCVTHDGDRVSRYDACEKQSLPYSSNFLSVTDARISRLIEVAAEGPGSPTWDSAQLRRQSGFYGASTPELDRIVDSIVPLPDVLGAGLMGAGGGGCVLVLARAGEDAFSRVAETLAEDYYTPLGLPMAVERWHPTPPAGEIVFDSRGSVRVTTQMTPFRASATGRAALQAIPRALR